MTEGGEAAPEAAGDAGGVGTPGPGGGDLIPQLLSRAGDIGYAANGVLIEPEAFQEVARFLEQLKDILKGLAAAGDHVVQSVDGTLQLLMKELRKAEEVTKMASTKSRLYLLVSCRAVVQQLQDTVREIGACISQLSKPEVPPGVGKGAMKLGSAMQRATFKAATAEDAIVEKIEKGIRENQVDSEFANELLLQISHTVGLAVDPAGLQAQIAELRKERADAELRKNRAEALHMEQIIALLSHADAAATLTDTEREYQNRASNSNVGGLPPGGVLPPLQSFICPITHELMEDPVEIASGQTFERAAIEHWISEGRTTCPTTGLHLANLEVKPNLALRQSIAEWRERNTAIQIQAIRPKLLSGEEGEVEAGMLDVFRLCEEQPLNRYYVAAEGLLPLVVDVLKSNSRNLRRKALATLTCLATDNDENKEAMVTAEAIPLAVRSLARDVGESRQAVSLLAELAQNARVCEEISHAQGSILLLVTLLSSTNASAARDAGAVLDAMAANDHNVVQMAEANHFKPLAKRLAEGNDMTRTVMASALSRMALTDQSKGDLAQEGAIPPLVAMIASGRLEAKTAALGALQNLSELPSNHGPMVAAGVLPPLLQLLFSVTSLVASFKEGAAATIANLAAASSAPAPGEGGGASLLEAEETIYQLLSLLNLTGAVIQSHILRALCGIAAAPGAAEARSRMRGGGAATVLIPFLESDEPRIRVLAAQVLRVLCRDNAGKEVAESLMEGGARGLKALTQQLRAREAPEERASAAGVVAALPPGEASVTAALMQADALGVLVEMLSLKVAKGPSRDAMLGGASGALIHFTLPSNLKLQKVVAEAGAIPLLVSVLEVGQSAAKRNAAVCLGNLAESTSKLSVPAKVAKGGCCFTPPPEVPCSVHGGQCDVKTTFCLLEADAVVPLVAALSDSDPGAEEAALGSLSTLLSEQGSWQQGLKLIHQTGGFLVIIQRLTGGTERARELSVWMLEKLFRIDEYKFEYGAKAQSALIELTQRGTNETKPVAAKILSHLEILHNQSSYF